MLTVQLVHDSITPALARLKAAMKNPAPAMRTIANILDRSVKANFRAEGRPKGIWPKLKPSTANAIRQGYRTRTRQLKGGGTMVSSSVKRRGYAHILRDTGRLIGSIQTRSGMFSAQVGAPGVVAAVHQLGTHRAGRGRHTTIPKRTFIGRSDRPQTAKFELLPEDEQAIEKAIDAWIKKAGG